MKYVLLALATVLAVFGCIATVANFSMVFEGTASNLIAGTVALGCGILVAGQVFILRALESLQTALAWRNEDFAAVARQVESPVAPAALDLAPQPLADALAPAPAVIDSALHKPAPFDLAFAPRRDAAPELAQPSPLGSDMAHAGEMPYASEMPHPAEEAALSAPPIDTDLLLKTALGAPLNVPAPPEAPVQPEEEKPAAAKTFAFERAPETSPSLSELWRRVSAKTPKKGVPAAEEPQLPPPPPIVAQPAAFAPDWASTHEAGHAHESPGRAEQHATEAAAPFEFEAKFEDVVAKSTAHEPVASDWLDRALADLDLPAPPMAEAHVAAEAENPLDDAAAEKSSAPPTAAVEDEPEPPSATGPSEMGRYQANGTTYIMFSDGSIEAQTETGVYRFGSMAELKAFFEEQAVVH
jgi:hypothetical protein